MSWKCHVAWKWNHLRILKLIIFSLRAEKGNMTPQQLLKAFYLLVILSGERWEAHFWAEKRRQNSKWSVFLAFIEWRSFYASSPVLILEIKYLIVQLRHLCCSVIRYILFCGEQVSHQAAGSKGDQLPEMRTVILWHWHFAGDATWSGPVDSQSIWLWTCWFGFPQAGPGYVIVSRQGKKEITVNISKA